MKIRKYILTCFCGLAVWTALSAQNKLLDSPSRKLQLAEFAISNLYVDKVDEDKLVETAIVSMLEKLDPQIIILGEAPSRHLNYYTGYQTITQNSAGDITMECDADQIHFFVSNPNYEGPELDDRKVDGPDNYLGSLTAETKYTL